MSIRRISTATAILLVAMSTGSPGYHAVAQSPGRLTSRYSDLPPGATRCDPSLPIWIDLSPMNEPTAGGSARFEVKVESILDPDLVKNSYVEYEVPARLRRLPSAQGRHAVLNSAGRGRTEMELVVPDERRYEIRAVLVVELTTGQVLKQTAVRWIDLGEEDPPAGMTGRIPGPDGTGIRIYSGTTVRN